MNRRPEDPLSRSAAEKMAQPKVKSNYEKDRNAQEAKRREEEAANAAVLREFEDSFGVDHNERDRRSSGSHRGPVSQRSYDTPGRYNSNYGSRGGYDRPGPGPPPSQKRKRQLEDQRERDAADYEHAEWQGQTMSKRPRETAATPRQPTGPVIHLGDLPPGMQQGQLRLFLSPYFTVQSITFYPPTKDSIGKRSITASATLAAGTAASAIDDGIDKLRNRYVGCGYNMTVSRTSTKTGLHPSLTGRGSDLPFGAQKTRDSTSMRSVASTTGRFAPPTSYDNRRVVNNDTEVNLDQALDIATMRAIHLLVDELLDMSQGEAHRAMEYEALIMRLPEVQSDPRMSFLYDSRSLAGQYYRYCLWSPSLLGSSNVPTLRLFADKQNLLFRRPSSKKMPFNTLTELSQAIDDPDYASSDEEGDGEEQQVLPHEMTDGMRTTLSPLHRARFAHLLARLPKAPALLRRGDVARVTNFAISHGATGIDEIVNMLIFNVAKPFSLQSVAKYQDDAQDVRMQMQGNDYSEDEDYDPEQPLPSIEESAQTITGTTADDTRPSDPSSAMRVGLLVLSDLLGAIHTAEGAKNAWKYRELLREGLREQKIFENLGQLDRQYGWGKMTAEQWRRRIDTLLDIWDGMLYFSKDAVASFRASFHHEQKLVSKKQTIETKVPAWRTHKPSTMPAGRIRVLEGGTVDAAEHFKAFQEKKAARLPEPLETPAEAVEPVNFTHPDEPGLKDVTSVQETAIDLRGSTDVVPVKEPDVAEPVAEDIGFAIKGAATKQSSAASKKRLRAEDMFGDEEW